MAIDELMDRETCSGVCRAISRAQTGLLLQVAVAWKLGEKEGISQVPADCGLAGARLSGCGRVAAGTSGEVLHHQPVGCAALAASLPGHQQRRRQSALGSPQPHAVTLPIAAWNGGTLVGSRIFCRTKRRSARSWATEIWVLKAILDGLQPATRQAMGRK
jgi:hypothetical protein